MMLMPAHWLKFHRIQKLVVRVWNPPHRKTLEKNILLMVTRSSWDLNIESWWPSAWLFGAGWVQRTSDWPSSREFSTLSGSRTTWTSRSWVANLSCQNPTHSHHWKVVSTFRCLYDWMCMSRILLCVFAVSLSAKYMEKEVEVSPEKKGKEGE